MLENQKIEFNPLVELGHKGCSPMFIGCHGHVAENPDNTCIEPALSQREGIG